MTTEFDIIDEIRRTFPTPDGTAIGIGDDTAVLDRQYELATTDVLVEEVHFRFDWCDPENVGWKTLTASLSDVAAMGGRPGPYLLSMAVAPPGRVEKIRGIVEGLRQCGEAMPEDLFSSPVGGDLSSSPEHDCVSVALYGGLAGSRPLLRSGAAAGDKVFLVGRPGRSAAGLSALGSDATGGPEFDPLLEAYRRPVAQVEAGVDLGESGLPSALIDVSDGLAQDLGHIARASGVGAVIRLDAIPVEPALREWCDRSGEALYEYLAAGGEDFCLLGTIAPDRLPELRRLAEGASWSFALIGDILNGDSGVVFLDERGEPVRLASSGYEHFSDR